MSSSLAAGTHGLLDQTHFAAGGGLLQNFGEPAADAVAALGFPGVELYRNRLGDYLHDPDALKALLDERGLTLATCSNGGADQCSTFVDRRSRGQILDDHMAFVRRFIVPFGCRHFKINLGPRPEAGPTTEHLRTLAGTLDELGRQCEDLGVRLAPHPHTWGPIERPEEVNALLELTDPALVSLTVDTAQIRLGGGDPLQLLKDCWDRVAALHWKDTDARYRDHTGPTPTREEHTQQGLYYNLGSGGIDFSGIWAFLQQNDYRYWVTLDLPPVTKGEGGVLQKLTVNKRYLTDQLRVGSL